MTFVKAKNTREMNTAEMNTREMNTAEMNTTEMNTTAEINAEMNTEITEINTTEMTTEINTEETHTESLEKRKKGRPRKEQPATEVTEGEKKKRGRKKKEVVVEEVKQKKKRGRKAAVKYFSSSIRKKIPLTTVIQDNHNYILHLDIQHSDGDKSPSIPDGPNSSNRSDGPDSPDSDSNSDTNSNNELNLEKLVNVMFETESDDVDKTCSIQKLLDNQFQSRDVDLEILYDKRIEFREEQDRLLVSKLELLHQDDSFIDKIILEKQKNVKLDKTNNISTKNREIEQSTNRKKGFFEMCYDLSSNKTWNESTDIACWWCCHQFSNTPIGMPVHYTNNIDKFRVKGVFCSFACMVAYKDDQKIKTTDSLIRFMYRKLTGECIGGKRIPKAPPRISLKLFGGELTIEQFRNSTTENKMYKLVEYPMYVSKDYIEEIDIANVKSANNKIFDDTSFTRVVNLDEKRIQDAKQRLSQIEKTTVTFGNTIDKFIKIT